MTEGRPVRDSNFEYAEIALPNDANPLGTLFGGKLMQWVDLAASISAARHARCTVVTASIDSLTFLRPVRIGQLVILRSSVNRVFRTSMEIGVKVFVEDLLTGDVQHVSSAYLTFVAVSQDGSRIPLTPVVAETPDEQRRFLQAEERRQYRLARRS
ncbi:MAG TPA: acyl-CoA thioesterase [Bryobacteraceae bacterium]|nr:acyl-CoA thioesterase [Bryobacteraceae bacterium]